MRKPFYRRRWVQVLALLLLAGIVTYFALLPYDYLRAQEDGRQFAREFPQDIAVEHGLRRAMTGNPAGPTVFLIHGSPGHWEDMGTLLLDARLTSRYLLIAPDRPGYGGSDSGVLVGRMDEQARRLAKLAEGKPRPWIWVGHSFGASIAARLAMEQPETVDGLLLIASAMAAEYEQPRWFHSLADQGWMRKVIGPDLDVSNQESLAFAAEFEEMADRWGRIAVPTTILHGDRDWMADYRHVAYAEAKLTAAPLEVVTIPGGDHLILWNRHDAVVEAIEKLAARVDAM